MSTADNVLRALHGLESNGPGKYLAFNPYNAPGQSRSKNLQLDITDADGEHGVFTLHSAQGIEKRSGSLYELAEIVGAKVERAAVRILPRDRTYRDLAHYAEAHGVPASAYEAAGWKLVTYTNRPALQFETQTGRRWRFLDNTGPRFLNKGKDGQSYKTCWYGLKNLPALLKSSGIPIVLCNGEPSVVAAQYHGVPALCMTTSSEKGIPADLLPALADVTPDARIIVALDCDEKGRDMAAKLVHQLDGLGYEVRAVDLGLLEGEDLADFCKLHTKDAAANLAALPPIEFRKATPDTPLDGYVPEQRPMPTVEVKQADTLTELNKTLGKLRADHRSADKDALAATLASARALIEQLEQDDGQSLLISGEDVANEAIARYAEGKKRNGALAGLPTGFRALDRLIDGFCPGVNVFLGATGMGKSWTMTSVCGYLVSHGYRGLAITTEMIPSVWMNRVAAYVGGLDAGDIRRFKLTTAQEATYAETLNTLETQVSFVRGVRPTPASLRATILNARMKGDLHFVIVDSASRLVGTGDNIGQETAAIQNALQELVLETELPFIVTGQVRGRDIANRAMKMPTIVDGFGSSSWEHNADVLIGLYNHDYYVKNFKGQVDPDPEFPEGTVAMRVLKNREGENVADQILKAKFIGGRGVYELDERRPPLHIYHDEEETA